MSVSNLALSIALQSAPSPVGGFTEHVLPGDTHAGHDLAVCAEAWSAGEPPVFVRFRVVSPDVAHVAVLSFDAGGFGTLQTETISAGDSLADACGGVLATAAHVVLLAPLGVDPEALGLNAALVEVRDAARVRLVEEEVLGVTRLDADIDPAVWIAARAGDRIAGGHVARAARADLFALVCLGGSDITIH